MSEVKSLKAQRSEQTREALLRAGRELFGERGYSGTATEEIVRRAGVTRGALYHQFRDKRDLFLAVFEAVESEFAASVAGLVGATTDPIESLILGCDAFLDASLDPTVRQIVLLDAPSVVGWRTWREVDAKYGLGLVRAVLEAAIDQGLVDEQPVTPLAHLLLGAMSEAAMVVAHADDIAKTRVEVGESCHRLIECLRVRNSRT